MATVSPATMGTISDPAAVAALLGGRCALCGRAHTGFGYAPRAALSLASCRCGATYQYRGEPPGAGAPSRPDSVTWYRAPYRATSAHPRPRSPKGA